MIRPAVNIQSSMPTNSAASQVPPAAMTPVAASPGLPLPHDIAHDAEGEFTQPNIMMMAQGKRIKKASTENTGGRRSANLPPERETFEERAAKWIETKLNQWFGEGFLGKIGRLFWNPPKTDGSCYKWAKKAGTLGRISGPSFAMHGPKNDLSIMIAQKVSARTSEAWRRDETAHIAELGAGSGALASVVREMTGAAVQEFDIFPGETSSDYRTIADVTNLSMVKTGAYHVAYSSFCLEYEGLPAFAEANRILAPGGRLVALVHHNRSSFYPHALNPGTWILAWLPRIILSITPLRSLLPRSVRMIFESSLRQEAHLKTAAFKNKSEATRMLERAGFVNVEITDALAAPVIFQNSKRLDHHRRQT